MHAPLFTPSPGERKHFRAFSDGGEFLDAVAVARDHPFLLLPNPPPGAAIGFASYLPIVYEGPHYHDGLPAVHVFSWAGTRYVTQRTVIDVVKKASHLSKSTIERYVRQAGRAIVVEKREWEHLWTVLLRLGAVYENTCKTRLVPLEYLEEWSGGHVHWERSSARASESSENS